MSPIDPRAAAASGPYPIAVIVDREGLGDVLLKLPMLRAIGRGFPGVPIWWIAAYQTSMADDLRPYFHDLVTVVRPLTDISSRREQMVQRLRELPAFSLVFDTRTRWSSNWHARRVLRRDRYYCCSPGYLLSDSRPGRLTRPRHIGERAMSLAQAALGTSADGSGALACSAAAQEMAQALLPAGPVYAGLAVGSREARKNWPLERFIELARALVTHGRVPVFLLGPQEASVSTELLRQIPESIALDFTQINPSPAIGVFDAVIAVAERLALVVANDSGLGHLAGAAGRPVVSLFGPTDPRRWAPMAPVRRVVRSQDCGSNDISTIPVPAVLKAVESVLDGTTGTKPIR
jgi:ADP-heptose:LPS heptosyltransferase